MNVKTSLLTVALLAVVFPAGAVNPATSGALPVPANRIVGMWSTEGAVGLCGSGTTPNQTRNTLLFQAGGTLVENPRFPPGGIGSLQRSAGLGTWTYDPVIGKYFMRLRIDYFINSVYDGYAVVERELLMSNDRQKIAGPVRSTRYAVDGSTISAVCGSAVSTRL